MIKGQNYKLNQMFGYKGPNQKVHEQDIIRVMKFNNSGDLLALGDHAGRIIVFETNKKQKKKQQLYDYYAQFQAHNKEFDCLRSQQIDESIVDICWLNTQSKYHKLLTTNSRSIKLWKVFQRAQKRVVKSKSSDFKIPTLQHVDSSFIANAQITFPAKHHSEIHSISKSNNEEYLLSFDDVQGFMWNLNRPDVPYIALDYLKGMEVEDVKENITCGKFHPSSDAMFVYGTNKKTLKVNDLRTSPREAAGVDFKYEQKENKNFFTEMLATYSSVDFLKGGKYVVARDFMTVKVWDINQNKKPLLEITLQENYKSKLCQMFENDCIDDKFKICGSPDGNQILTGSYNNNFHLIDLMDGTNNQFQINYKKQTLSRQLVPGGKSSPITRMDYEKKSTAVDFSPRKNLFAVATLNTFFVYSG